MDERGEILRPDLMVVTIDLTNLHESDYLRGLRGEARHGPGISTRADWLMSLGMASKSDYLEEKDLGHNMGKTSFTMPAAVAIALCTAVPEDSKTGATIVEATTYTGYARKAVVGSELTISGTSPTKIASNTEIKFAACTAGSAVIVGFAICDSATTGAGNMLYWGTVTSTTISTTQTPATIASGALEITED